MLTWSGIFKLLSLVSFPFSYMTQLLTGHKFADRGVLLEAVKHILDGIEKVTFDRIFLT
jgi:hypothetical protein